MNGRTNRHRALGRLLLSDLLLGAVAAAGGAVREVSMEYLKMRIVLHTTPRNHGSVRTDVAE